jgi:hypothetical protein
MLVTVSKNRETADDCFLFNGQDGKCLRRIVWDLSLGDGNRLYKSYSHYGAADKEGQIVGMRGAARGSHAVEEDDKDVC